MNVLLILIVGIAIWWGVLFIASLCSPEIAPDLRRATNKLRSLTPVRPLNSAASLLFVALFLPLYLTKYPLALAAILLLWGVIAHWTG